MKKSHNIPLRYRVKKVILLVFMFRDLPTEYYIFIKQEL